MDIRVNDELIMKKPHLVEEGFTPTAREYSVEHGFIDILGKDKDNNLMILELKARKAGVNAVKQLKRYLLDFENTDNDEGSVSEVWNNNQKMLVEKLKEFEIKQEKNFALQKSQEINPS